MDDGDRAIAGARRVCFFAHYHPHGIAADHVLIYLHALADAGFAVVVLSTATMPPEERRKLADACAMLIVRDNVGLDFGGWIEAIARFFPIAAELLLFANDSVYAPIGDLAGFIDRLIAEPADFYGAIESHEIGQHLQSWFLLFRPSAYNSAAFRTLLGQPIPPTMSKAEIIATYEVGLTARLTEAGLRYHAAYQQYRDGWVARWGHLNAGHLLWRELIGRAKMPFLKIELLRDNPCRVRNIRQWREVVGRRSPRLRDAIARDLADRRKVSEEELVPSADQLLFEPNKFFWPELQHYVRRDYRLKPGSLLSRINGKLFHHAFQRAQRKGRNDPERAAITGDNAATPR